MPRFDKDRLNSLHPHAAVDAAYASVSAIQDRSAEAQVAGPALLLLVTCEVLGLDLSEVIDKARRMASDDDNFYQAEVRALRAYVKGELKQ